MSPLNILLLAADAVLASIALPFLASLLARAYPNNAARRRLVWTMLFAVLLALPLVAALSPSLAVITLHGPAAASPGPVSGPAPADPPLLTATAALLLGLYAWVIGALWIVGRSTIGLVRLHLLKAGSEPVSPERLPLPLARRCRALLSPECTGPMTWGVLRPVILLPDDALDWPRSKLEAALRHELAHVRRKDSLVQALALLACALYWPNPLVWRAARALRREAEAAADDEVLASGVRPSDYAGLLLDLASDWGSPRRSELEMAMAQPPILSERVQSILSPDASRTGATPMDAFKLALVGGAAVAALALARPSIAEVAAPPPAATPTTTAVPYNPVTDDPASPGYIAAGKPGAGHPVPAKLAKLLNARKNPTAPWTLGWVPNPNGAPPAAPAAPAAPAPAAKPSAEAQPASPIGIRVGLKDAGVGAIRGPDGKETALTAEQRAELDRKMASIRPELQKALADSHIEETVRKALKDAHIEETVAKALKEANADQIVAHSRLDLSVGQGPDPAKP